MILKQQAPDDKRTVPNSIVEQESCRSVKGERSGRPRQLMEGHVGVNTIPQGSELSAFINFHVLRDKSLPPNFCCSLFGFLIKPSFRQKEDRKDTGIGKYSTFEHSSVECFDGELTRQAVLPILSCTITTTLASTSAHQMSEAPHSLGPGRARGRRFSAAASSRYWLFTPSVSDETALLSLLSLLSAVSPVSALLSGRPY